jgi:STAS domain-containing protein
MARRATRRGELLIEVYGVFDVPAANRVGRTLERARPGDAIRIDVARVSEFQDFGLAILAQALRQTSAARVALRGLRDHQLRILGYFGVDAARLRHRVPALELDVPGGTTAADVA